MKFKLPILITAGSLLVVGILFGFSFSQNSCDAQGCSESNSSISEIDAIKKELDSGAILVDVRTPEEFAQSHAVGAINISHDRILNGEYPSEDKDTKIYLYCRSGSRASMAQKSLEDAGFVNVESVMSLDYWQNIGGEIE